MFVQKILPNHTLTLTLSTINTLWPYGFLPEPLPFLVHPLVVISYCIYDEVYRFNLFVVSKIHSLYVFVICLRFPIVNFPYLSSNIPESPAYGVFVSKLIRYAWVCLKYEDFLCRGYILVSKLLKQGYSSRKLLTTFRKLYGRHADLVHKFDTSVSHMLKGLFTNCELGDGTIYKRLYLTGAVGSDEDNYGQEMALYLNEDDILKPGQKNHVALGNHGILQYCSKDDVGMIMKTIIQNRVGANKLMVISRAIWLMKFVSMVLCSQNVFFCAPVFGGLLNG